MGKETKLTVAIVLMAAVGLAVVLVYVAGLYQGRKNPKIEVRERIVYKTGCSCQPTCECCECRDRKRVEVVK